MFKLLPLLDLQKSKHIFRKLNRKELLGEEEINLLKLYLALRGISFDQETLQGKIFGNLLFVMNVEIKLTI